MPKPYNPNPSELFIPPSISPIPSVPLNELLVGACPKITNPAQSPRCGVAASEVKIIGLVAVPSAIILAPLQIIKAPFLFSSPTIFVPGSIVKIAPFVTYTKPLSL